MKLRRRPELYHQIGTLKNQNGELIDDQITHVVVELEKFQKTLIDIETNLDKLLYTMKLTDTASSDAKLPDFLKEDWLEETLKELDRSNLTPDQRADLEMTIAGNVSDREALENELKIKTLDKLLKKGKLTEEEIADALDLPLEIVVDRKKTTEEGK